MRRQLVKRGAIKFETRRLPQHRFVPFQPQPTEILEDSVDIFLARSRGIDILDAKQEAPACRGVVSGDCGERMTQMKMACWTGRKARDKHGADP